MFSRNFYNLCEQIKNTFKLEQEYKKKRNIFYIKRKVVRWELNNVKSTTPSWRSRKSTSKPCSKNLLQLHSASIVCPYWSNHHFSLFAQWKWLPSAYCCAHRPKTLCASLKIIAPIRSAYIYAGIYKTATAGSHKSGNLRQPSRGLYKLNLGHDSIIPRALTFMIRTREKTLQITDR